MSSRITPMGARLQPIPSEEHFDREAAADEVADEVRQGEAYDANKLKDRALAINSALNTLDFVPITGRQYWSVYSAELDRRAFGKWARKGLATLTDIVAELDRIEGRT